MATTVITIADSKYWKIPAENKRKEIDAIKQNLIRSGVNPLPLYQSGTISDPNWSSYGPWQQLYWRNIDELNWWKIL